MPITRVPTVEYDLSPDAFHIYATHYLKCKRDFQPPDKDFSPVPYFLLCRAIELEIKARHLKHMGQKQVIEFGHDLVKAYDALDPIEKTLNPNEKCILRKASDLYKNTDFTYFNPMHLQTFYKQFPDLGELDAIASKWLGAENP